MSGAATSPGQDPSMEDILASIRKILNEEEGAVSTEAAPAASREAAPEPLELTEAMLVPPPAPEPEPAVPEVAVPAPEAVVPAPVRDLAPVPPPVPVPPVGQSVGQAVEPPAADFADGLVAPATAAATAALIGQLARTVAAERAAPVHRGGPSIEDVVREEVRPLLKEWMDAHLPAMVERLVRAEIERVVSRSLG